MKRKYWILAVAGLALFVAGVFAADTTVNVFDATSQTKVAVRYKDNLDTSFSQGVWITQGGNYCKVDANGTLQTGELPPGTSVTATSTGGAQANNCTLAGVAAKTTYITGFEITGLGATGASGIAVTVTGCIGGTLNYTFPVPAGVTVGATPLIVVFPIPIAASAVNTAIVVNVPSFGTGNTAASVTAHGFQL